MNELQTMQFAIGCSIVLIILILGIVIAELMRSLSKEREKSERLRQMNSRNYHHRAAMEDAITNYKASLSDPSFTQLLRAAQNSKADHD